MTLDVSPRALPGSWELADGAALQGLTFHRAGASMLQEKLTSMLQGERASVLQGKRASMLQGELGSLSSVALLDAGSPSALT